ncbi:MAG: DUF1778 domain-containing protein [Nitrospira sp. LK265]|nr:DUF1778 domain-containing protein [Nitrospira sp.]NGZ60981.1 DUF1778 domain-containing protein [Nitrospira sp. LK265]
MPARSVRKEKLDLRLSSADKRTLEAAASVSNRSVSEFVRDSALSRADEMLVDRRTFVVSQAKWAEFQAALDAPTRRIPRMQRLLTEPGFFDADPSSTRSEKR